MPLWLTRKDVESLLSMKDTIEAVEEGFRRLALNQVAMPQRTVIRLSEPRGLHLAMPALVQGPGASSGISAGILALKSVTVFPENPSRFDLPTTLATVILCDPHTGELLAIMDGGYLTAMRTGAASGVATKYLAREDVHVAGVFGAGVQARAQLMAVCEVRRLESALVFDPVADARNRFAAEMSAKLSLPVRATEDARACAEADVVIAATSSKTPIFDGSWLRPGAHINGVGAHSPDARELDTETVRRARIIADHIPSRLAEDGDFLVPLKDGAITADHVRISLGDVILGKSPGRLGRRHHALQVRRPGGAGRGRRGQGVPAGPPVRRGTGARSLSGAPALGGIARA